jgi:Reverse transcriptase (RNA-dependent DNA polymerase)
LKALYGLKAAPALWQKILHEYIFKMGFVSFLVDHCLFMKGIITIVIWVDDMLACGPDKKELD